MAEQWSADRSTLAPEAAPALTQSEIDQRVLDLYDEYCHGSIDRREFLQRAGALTIGGVSALAMAQARALNIQGPLLREFGFAALMHDIGKVNTPLEVLNKPYKLTKDEFEIMKRHVVDGAHILRRTPEMPALA